jgi:hypothetical protein
VTGVMLGQSAVPMLLFTVHGRVRPIVGTGVVMRVPVAPRLARGLHVSLGRGISAPRGSGTPMLTLQGSGEAEIILDRA